MIGRAISFFLICLIFGQVFIDRATAGSGYRITLNLNEEPYSGAIEFSAGSSDFPKGDYPFMLKSWQQQALNETVAEFIEKNKVAAQVQDKVILALKRRFALKFALMSVKEPRHRFQIKGTVAQQEGLILSLLGIKDVGLTPLIFIDEIFMMKVAQVSIAAENRREICRDLFDMIGGLGLDLPTME